MNRRPRPWPLLAAALALLACPPAGCDYGGQATVKNPAIYGGRLPTRIGGPGGGPAASPAAGAGSTASSAEQDKKREAILNNVIQLIQSAATTPGGQHFGIAVKNLNEYFEQGTRPADYYLSVDSRKFLQSQAIIGSAEAVRGFESPTFGLIDARHIEDCMLYNEIAHRVAGERLPGEADDLPRVRRLFDWMVRQVQLVPGGSLAPPGSPQQAYARPYDVLLRGMATEMDGGWSERGWLFMSLCRQLGVDVGLVSYAPGRAPAAFSIAPADESADQPVVWACLALVGGKAYLFDQRLGLAIPDARGDGVATLPEALADPRVLDRLDLPGQSRYPTTRSALLAAGGKVTILIDSGRGYFSPKMRLLQARLTGKNRTILFRDPVEQGRHFAAVLGRGLLEDVRAWPLPFATEEMLFTKPEFTQATLYTLRPFDGNLPILYARVAQLKGDLAEAIPQYVAMRKKAGGVKRDKKAAISPAEQHEIDAYATYFLALCHLEQKNAEQAALFFRLFLQDTPEPVPGAREFCHMFRWGAQMNLGLIARDRGDLPGATRYLSAPCPTPQAHGDLWTARELVWRDPTSPPAPPLPPAPAPPPSAIPAALQIGPPNSPGPVPLPDPGPIPGLGPLLTPPGVK